MHHYIIWADEKKRGMLSETVQALGVVQRQHVPKPFFSGAASTSASSSDDLLDPLPASRNAPFASP